MSGTDALADREREPRARGTGPLTGTPLDAARGSPGPGAIGRIQDPFAGRPGSIGRAGAGLERLRDDMAEERLHVGRRATQSCSARSRTPRSDGRQTLPAEEDRDGHRGTTPRGTLLSAPARTGRVTGLAAGSASCR